MAAPMAAVLAPLSLWFNAVNNTVPEPYLDEVFHIRQAQHYCLSHWDIWDPKITTPPGLYLLSYALQPLIGCSIPALRFLNELCLIALLLVVRATYTARRKTNHERGQVSGILATHSALNIVLFPPLFFFSALYYTDVASTLSVVVFYWYFLKGLPQEKLSLGRIVVQTVLGLLSLMFRQTNIFWVAVMPAILTTVVELDQGHKVVKESMYRRAEGFGDSMTSVARTSWKMGVVYDPPVRDAFFEDYIRTLLSLSICFLRALTRPPHLLSLLRGLLPSILLLLSFLTFILLNGSVVLGDKSNHVATPNLPQLLYHQTFTAFFAWPLLLPLFLLIPLVILSRLTLAFCRIEPLLIFRRRSFLPRISLFAAFTLLAMVVVYANTTIHPFLLADNRHYYFYIFRRIMRPWWVRYALCPVYILCGWAAIHTRGTSLPSSPTTSSPGPPQPAQNQQETDPLAQSAASSARTRSIHLPTGTTPPTISFALTLLFTTALTLCTAPLVEPRYCIVPYIFWRMHVPLSSPSAGHETAIMRSQGKGGKEERLGWRDVLREYDWRVVVETIWLLAVNGITGWVFLKKGFEWPQERGVVQRFMW
ncbi:alpha-1,2 glucosyltransferase alg10 like protein [Zymoseptoria brevis]|uniref:Dol-P-Glc:Glc(2)Man(9)GlcNAc(2)-PP-Dol alpha-1,2-glucosyltransferase n=1 Tax=Zymoseptoria brevis TaxID=1047168 RepID=A0A0F4G970_9PEZI|nr:alpha-1,2 glucosyltransferase alg10 like protein [Zymoseptoria brevis]